MKYKVTFEDLFYIPDGFDPKEDSEEFVYEALLDYLNECVRNGDVTAFKFEEVKE